MRWDVASTPQAVTNEMTLCRNSVRMAQLARTLLGSLLLAGCGSENGTAPGPVAPAKISATMEPAAALRRCPEPKLRRPGVERIDETILAGFPAPPPLERLPGITRTFPSSVSETPLPVASLPRSIIRDVRPLPDERNGPALVGPEIDAAATVNSPGPFAETGLEARTQRPLAPTAEPMTRRPREMDAVARQAEAHVRHGYSLAARGALYSARAEFVLALRIITQALDLQSGNREHSQALAVGLGALEEAEDFIPLGSRLEADLDINILISAHRTPVLKNAPSESLLPVVALQRYYTYAQEQLGRAAGHEEAGSMALYGLGKVYGTMADNKLPNVVAPEPKAMVFHQAAIETHPGNFMAANELAVLSARYGRYEAARELLRHGASIAGYSAIWQNLAVVHRQLGETELAALAQNEATLAAQRESAAAKAGKLVPSSDVHWVDADTFAGTSKPTTDLQRPAAMQAGPGASQPASMTPDTAVAPTATRSWWPFSARNQSQAQPGQIKK